MHKFHLIALAGCVSIPALASGNTLLQIEPTTGGTYVSAFGLSDDGSTVVGYYRTTTSGGSAREFEWTPGQATVTDIGSLPTNQKAYGFGISSNGAIITGISGSSASGSNFDATEFTGGSISDIGNVGGGSGAVPTLNTRVSQDGSTFIAINSNGQQGYYMTSSSGGWKAMNTLAGAPAVETADGVSANGSVITGRVITTSGGTVFEQTYRYSAGSGFQLLDTPSAASNSSSFPPQEPNVMTPVSGNGNFVASTSTFTSGGSTQLDAYEFNATTDKITRFDAPLSITSIAGFSPTAVTDDGSYVVGRDGNGQGGWIWSEATGFESITQFLTNNGLDPASVGGTGDAYGVALNGDVLTITGLDFNGSVGTSYYAQVTVPEPASICSVAGACALLLLRRRRRV